MRTGSWGRTLPGSVMSWGGHHRKAAREISAAVRADLKKVTNRRSAVRSPSLLCNVGLTQSSMSALLSDVWSAVRLLRAVRAELRGDLPNMVEDGSCRAAFQCFGAGEAVDVPADLGNIQRPQDDVGTVPWVGREAR